MRFKTLLLWDMKFQARYGFYLLYGFLTVFYIVLLFSLPLSWKENAAAILIYSDPAAMGLYFIFCGFAASCYRVCVFKSTFLKCDWYACSNHTCSSDKLQKFTAFAIGHFFIQCNVYLVRSDYSNKDYKLESVYSCDCSG